jgi:hypothetical protein
VRLGLKLSLLSYFLGTADRKFTFKKTRLRYSHTSIKNILRRLNYSLQKNQKYDQVGRAHPMRDMQFCHISAKKHEYISNGDPVISIDTKAKEKLGDFIRPGTEYRRKHDPKRVLDHDFAFTYREIYPEGNNNLSEDMFKKKAVVIPYGIYCLNNNTGYTVIGVDHDTSEFAADSIALWWKKPGQGTISECKADPYTGRRRREQPFRRVDMESRPAAAVRYPRSADRNVPLSSRNQQIQSNRTPYVVPGEPFMDSKTVKKSGNHTGLYRPHQYKNRSVCRLRDQL